MTFNLHFAQVVDLKTQVFSQKDRLVSMPNPGPSAIFFALELFFFNHSRALKVLSEWHIYLGMTSSPRYFLADPPRLD